MTVHVRRRLFEKTLYVYKLWACVYTHMYNNIQDYGLYYNTLIINIIKKFGYVNNS